MSKIIEEISAKEQVKLMILIGKTIIDLVNKEEEIIEENITKGMMSIAKT